MVKGGHGANNTHQGCHWVRIAAETTEEVVHLFMHHGVAGHAGFKIFQLCRRWQLAVEQKIADL